MRTVCSIWNCIRCRENHTEVEMCELSNPSDEWTHWAMCPVKLEPVLIRVLQSAPEKTPPTETPTP